jgi:leucyl/phenylalanyl-tRNA--protein transferase
MLEGYRRGTFAWSDDPVTWWSPDPRAIIDASNFHVSRSLRRRIGSGMFDVTVDKAFREVVVGCSQPRPTEEGTWISQRFLSNFTGLHANGQAHSVETWSNGRLVGGVFGVAVGGFFSAESMFHRETDASKVALFHLVHSLERAGYSLIDIQMLTSHTESLGAYEIPRTEYLSRLAEAIKVSPRQLSIASDRHD